MNKELIVFRKELHAYPDLSSNEGGTAKRVVDFLKQFSPTHIQTEIGGTGVIAVFDSGKTGKNILFRCELDALPTDENMDMEHSSTKERIAHKCGHDGHMAMVAGIAQMWLKEPLQKGKIALLFQPAEETGEGAKAMLTEGFEETFLPDYVFALHNLPGYKKGKIVIREQTFAAGSKGYIIKLIGKTAHAAEPENGNSPVLAVAELINKMNTLVRDSKLNSFSLVTPIHVKVGERAFGTTPGYAEVMATLRSYSEEDLNLLSNNMENLARETAIKYNLQLKTEWVEVFPVTVNNSEATNFIAKAAQKLNYEVEQRNEPFRWSEDFGHFTKKYKGAMFGLGAGENQPALHNPDYDFPDEIIEYGTNLFYTIAQTIINEE